MSIKSNTIRMTALFFRQFYQKYPLEHGKWFIWKNIISPHINSHELPFTILTKTGEKLTVVLYDYIQQRLFYFGIWEPTLTKYISDNLSQGDIFVDVGANIGYYSCMAANIVGDTGTVHAIEASPKIFLLLCNNISLNKANNIQSHNIAVSNQQGFLSIYAGKKSNIGQTTTRIENSSEYKLIKETEIQADTLDNIIGINDLINARIIKIDVEGAEWQVLQGIENIIPHLSHRTEIVIEISPVSLLKQGIHPQQIIKIFLNSGYSAYTIEDANEPSNYMKNKSTQKIRPLQSDIVGQLDILFSKNPHHKNADFS